MKPFELLREKRLEIADNLFKCIVKTYEKETERFLIGGKDRFENPMGWNFKDATWGLLDEIFGKNRDSEIKKNLETIIKIRAIQDFEPSEAILFVIDLKNLILDVLNKNSVTLDKETLSDILLLTDKIYLMAMDIYMNCRENFWQIKFNEVMNRPFFHTEGGMCLSYLIKKGKVPGAASESESETVADADKSFN
jgi:hypothetical protein